MQELNTLISLDDKIKRTQELIDCWVESWGEDGVFVAFSGGKDSTVLLDIVRKSYPSIPGVFYDTGLELPEIKKFIKETDNIIIRRPKIPFHKVIEQYGWPVISKAQSQRIYEYRNTKSEYHKNNLWNGLNGKKRFKISEKWKFMVDAPFKISNKCCTKLKKDTAKLFEKETGRMPMIGMMGSEGNTRAIIAKGSHSCNRYDAKTPTSNPIMHWNDNDVWEYIKKYNVKYSTAYDKGWKRTGCIFCMYGLQYDDPNNNRFHMLKKQHPKLYDYCINKLCAGEVLDFMGYKY